MVITPLDEWMALKLNPKGQRLTREMIASHQLCRLKETIARARARSAFYRERFGALTEKDLTDLADLPRFPFTSAEDLRKNPLRLLCVSQDDVSRVVTLQSSGTTGAPKRIYFTAADQEATIDFFHHGMSTLAGPGDRVMILLPGDRAGSVGALLKTGLERLGAIPFPHGPVRDAGKTLAFMKRERIDALIGVPTHVLALARHDRDRRAAPKNVLLTTDHVPEAIRGALKERWGCAVYNHYGMTEMGYGGGVECRARCGYHLRELDLFVEIVDPRTGSPPADGEPGEVVFSTLTREGMPLIRYRTGDLSRFLPGSCPCQTVLRRLEKVTGRVAGAVPLAGGQTVTMADLDEALFPVDGLLDFTAGFTREGKKDLLRIEAYVMDGNRAACEEAIRQSLQGVHCLEAALKGDGLRLRIDIRGAKAMPAPQAAKRTLRDDRFAGKTPAPARMARGQGSANGFKP